MPHSKRKKRRKRKRSTRVFPRASNPNSMVKVMGDTAKLAIGAAAVTAVTVTAVSALKR